MKKERVAKLIVIILCALLVLLAFFAKKIVFYDAKMTPSDYSYVKTSKKPVHVNTSFWFNYGELRELQYGYDKGIKSSDVKVYTKTSKGIESFPSNQFGPIKKDCTGYVIAVVPEQKFDIDGDGKEEKVYDFARTEFGTYAYLGGPPELFNSKDIEFELLFSGYKYMQVYYNNELVTRGKITVISYDGEVKDYKINEKGQIDNLPISNIRNGFTAIYTMDGETYCRMYYVLEG